MLENILIFWFKFKKNPFSIIGLIIVSIVILITIFAPFITPFPEHAGKVADFSNMNQPPSNINYFGTDTIGRDVFSRTMFAYRTSFFLSLVVLLIAVPVGIFFGLLGGYFSGLFENILMRIVDVFLSLPALVLAMVIIGLTENSMTYIMAAISLLWWPWYSRLVYSITKSVKNEDYIAAAKICGASNFHILFFEILPNCLPSILTKITTDLAFVIMIIAALGFVGLGVQPPIPDLGRMTADGMDLVFDSYWLSLFPGLAILFLVVGFNLLGDGLREAFDLDLR
jgi:peptide/nickel transport system permease protein|tara:strand:+ start:45 stop:893 length:849 start_codon:yes stop_codon:yes gene_type:complete